MNTEQAIEEMEKAFDEGYYPGREAIGLALVALREAQKREKGCSYCMGPELLARPSQLYCDMCGRKLESRKAQL